MLGVFVWTCISSCSLVPSNYLRVVLLRNRIQESVRFYLAAIRLRSFRHSDAKSARSCRMNLRKRERYNSERSLPAGPGVQGEHLIQMLPHLFPETTTG